MAASIIKPPYTIGSVPSLSGHAIAYRWRSLPRVRRHRASKPQGSSERVLPRQITMDQLIFASLSHTHYWYEVGMLKVPAVTPAGTSIEVQNEWEENTHTHSSRLVFFRRFFPVQGGHTADVKRFNYVIHTQRLAILGTIKSWCNVTWLAESL